MITTNAFFGFALQVFSRIGAVWHRAMLPARQQQQQQQQQQQYQCAATTGATYTVGRGDHPEHVRRSLFHCDQRCAGSPTAATTAATAATTLAFATVVERTTKHIDVVAPSFHQCQWVEWPCFAQTSVSGPCLFWKRQEKLVAQ